MFIQRSSSVHPPNFVHPVFIQCSSSVHPVFIHPTTVHPCDDAFLCWESRWLRGQGGQNCSPSVHPAFIHPIVFIQRSSSVHPAVIQCSSTQPRFMHVMMRLCVGNLVDSEARGGQTCSSSVHPAFIHPSDSRPGKRHSQSQNESPD